MERLKKFVNRNEEIAKYFTMGNNVSSNKDVVTTIEYDDLSKVYTEFKCAKTYFMFNQEKVQEYMKKMKRKISCILVNTKEKIVILIIILRNHKTIILLLR